MATLFNISQACCSYGAKEVLHRLDLTLRPGLFYGLAGPNGSGKTTLLDLLLGNKSLDSGTVLFQNQAIASYAKRALAKMIALVPQEFRISFEFTAKEVVMMGRHPHIGRFANPGLADLAIVERVMHQLGIDALRDRYVTELSGGEKQRVIVARALAQDTPVLILDEATANLDIHHSIQILRTVKKLVSQQQLTVIAAIHDLNFAAAYCDEMILLDKGRLIATGPTAEVLTPARLQAVFDVACRTYRDDYSGAYQIGYKYLS